MCVGGGLGGGEQNIPSGAWAAWGLAQGEIPSWSTREATQKTSSHLEGTGKNMKVTQLDFAPFTRLARLDMNFRAP